jgi:predicted amidohydrolase
VDTYSRDHPNQPHHAGTALIFGPDGELLAHAQTDRIQEEMVLAALDAATLARERSQSNYTVRTRRPELFGELTRDQVTA